MDFAQHPTFVMVDEYLARLESSVARRELGYPPIDDLWARLGCPYWEDDEVKYLSLSAADKVAAQGALTKLLGLVRIVGVRKTSTRDVCNILSTLYDAGHWERCLETTSAAYDLAASICLAIPYLDNPDEPARDVIIAILNKWIDPVLQRWQTLPDVTIVAKCLFGSVWYEMALGDIDEDSLHEIAAAIVRQRPPFLPGLCPAQLPIDSLPLPDELGALG